LDKRLKRSPWLLEISAVPIYNPRIPSFLYVPFTANLESGSIIINWVEVRTSDPNVPFQVMVFESQPPEDCSDWEQEDLIRSSLVNQRVYKYIPSLSWLYQNHEKTPVLYGGVVLGQRPCRFDIPDNEEENYYNTPVTITITIHYIVTAESAT
jgi:hypothetical protein